MSVMSYTRILVFYELLDVFIQIILRLSKNYTLVQLNNILLLYMYIFYSISLKIIISITTSLNWFVRIINQRE